MRVFVTGGSRGIGEAIVRACAARGDRVCFTYHQSADRAARLASQTGADALFCDLRDPVALRDAVRAAGQIDLLVNNAGICSRSLITDLSEQDYRDLMAVNLDAVFFVCQAALPGMIRRHGGSIVNISSVWGKVGASCEVAYSASKAGVIGLTRALAKEVGPSGIRVNCILPGVIDTDMNASLGERDLADLASGTPLCRIGRPEEVAAAVLALSDAPFVTGQCLSVDGGFA